jgi:peroxiredoxin
MKQYVLTALVFFVLLTSASAQNSPEIKLRAEGYDQGTAYLIGIFTEQQYRLDSAKIDASGTMVFKREEPYPQGLVFAFLPDQTIVQMLLDEDQRFELSTKKGSIAESMVVTGSLENTLLYDNLRYENSYNAKNKALGDELAKLGVVHPQYQATKDQRDQLVKDRRQHLDQIFTQYPNTLFTSFKKGGQNPDLKEFFKPDGSRDTALQVYTYRMEFWDNVNFNDNRLLRTPVISNKLKRYMTELTAQNADSIKKSASFLIDKVLDKPDYFKYFANWITLQYEPKKSTVMDADAIYVHMIQNYFTHDKAFWSDTFELNFFQRQASEMAQSLVGLRGPEVVATDFNGNKHAISDLKSDYVIVYLFSTECSHCIEESPKLVKFYNEWKDKGVGIYAIGLGQDRQEWWDFVKKNGMDKFTNVNDPTNKAIYKTYYVDVTPEIYVLNPERIIVGKNIKVSQIAEIIERDRKR